MHIIDSIGLNAFKKKKKKKKRHVDCADPLN